MNPAGRNCRDVWTIPTESFPDAHFATFPRELVRRCVFAGTSERGCCPECGKPYERITAEGELDVDWQRASGGDVNGEYHGTSHKHRDESRAQNASTVKARILAGMRKEQTTAWRPTCSCDAGDPVACVVLDPFCGSGTTGEVALTYGRAFVGIDLKEEYLRMALPRLQRPLATRSRRRTDELPDQTRKR